jgi:hypothetical protein
LSFRGTRNLIKGASNEISLASRNDEYGHKKSQYLNKYWDPLFIKRITDH